MRHRGRGQLKESSPPEEVASAGEGAQAARYLLPELGHADVAFSSVVIKRDVPVVGETQIVVLAVQPARSCLI